ncbi:hypothetical protein [Muribacter muris]|uniref:hypothetical protein n=1 Tax=Muribacter muris TaxID=67855 RepID=UPI000AA39D47|nr:hypothetical protein [Muribacter muris]
MTYPQQKAICQLDEHGFFIGETQADLSPLEADEGVYLMPANTVDVAPPEEKIGFLAQWRDDAWHYIEQPQYLPESSTAQDIEAQPPTLAQYKNRLLIRIADQTDRLKAQYLQGYSQAEIDSFYRQEREARGELPLMLLTELFEGRNDLASIEQLKEKVIEKADLFAIIMGKTFAIKQGFEVRIEQATSLDELAKIDEEVEQWQSI